MQSGKQSNTCVRNVVAERRSMKNEMDEETMSDKLK
jgi:hypothetical protein